MGLNMERLSKAIPNNRVSKMVENSKLTKLSLTHEPLDPDTLCSLLRWIDAIKLSRPKKCLHRDFADAVLVAEIISHFFPAKHYLQCILIANLIQIVVSPKTKS